MRVVIFGSGTLAELAYYYLRQEMKANVEGFVVDKLNKELSNEFKLNNLPIYSWSDFVKKFRPDQVKIHIAIAYKNMRNKKKVFERVLAAGFNLINIVSKSAFISEDTILGLNNFIMPNVVLEPFTRIGNNNIIWSNSTICHNTHIGNHNFLASNVTFGGKSKVGDLCFFGFSSTITDYINVENEVLLAANSFLNKDAKTLTRFQGNPAEKFSKININEGIIF